MIGLLEGVIISCDGEEVIISTNAGIGYEVYCKRTFPLGMATQLFITTVTRETGTELYGFTTLGDKKLFEALLTVKGVGPKSAYGLLHFLGADRLREALVRENATLLKEVPGIGAKTATQIILDLKGKAKKLFSVPATVTVDTSKVKGAKASKGSKESIPVEKGQTSLFDAEIMEREINIDRSSAATVENAISFQVWEDTLAAMKELGFGADKVIPVAQKILQHQQSISRSEDFIRLLLREFSI